MENKIYKIPIIPWSFSFKIILNFYSFSRELQEFFKFIFPKKIVRLEK